MSRDLPSIVSTRCLVAAERMELAAQMATTFASALSDRFFPKTSLSQFDDANNAVLTTLGYQLPVTARYFETRDENTLAGWLVVQVLLSQKAGDKALCTIFLDEFGNIRNKPDLSAPTFDTIKDKGCTAKILDQVHRALFAAMGEQYLGPKPA